MFGEPLEEDNYDPNTAFYDHQLALANHTKAILEGKIKPGTKPGSKQLKLKKKIVYSYEYSDPSDDEGVEKQKWKKP